ncbi:MAG TPA: glycosyltransferase [Candidatus Acidoferrales bacterium]|nr:glycosyltransferase [Candidatus Acidoferrales bacterium]
MHTFATVLFALVAGLWIFAGIAAGRGMSRLPRLSASPPAAGANLPRISILFAARDEAEKLPAAVASLLALDYPNLEIVAANDRSTDSTPQLLDDFARRDPRLRVIHISELPQGWLGKPHALEVAYRASSGEWLVFTDADVRFAPELLRRSFAVAQEQRLDHLTLLSALDLRGFWEPVAVGYLGICFALGARPWQTNDPKSKTYMGVGAFQLIRRSAYEAIGTHRRLAMEVLDDMKLGKLVKQHGFRSGVAPSDSLLDIRWQEGIGNVIRGMTKNMFAGFEFKVPAVLVSVLAIFCISVLPFVGLFAAAGAAWIAAAIASAAAVVFEAGMMPLARASRWFGLTHPLGALIVIYIILRSMVVTLARGGVVWRGTFYPIEELKRGMV